MSHRANLAKNIVNPKVIHRLGSSGDEPSNSGAVLVAQLMQFQQLGRGRQTLELY